MNKELKDTYNKVFDENGNIKTCGRQACINLLRIIEQETNGTIPGDIKTGIMNIEMIKDIYANLCEK